MNKPHFRGNFFATALCHCLLLKVRGSMSDYFESLHDYLSREKFKANNERHKTEAFLNCELQSSFPKLVIH